MLKNYLNIFIFLFFHLVAVAQSEVEITANILGKVKEEVDQFYPTFARQWLHVQPGKPWFIGSNYALFNNEYSNPFSLSVYHSIGGFVQGIQLGGSALPQKSYSTLEFNQICKELDAMNLSYTKPGFVRELRNYKTFSAGVYLAIKGPFYAMAGITHLNRTNWDLYKGNMENYLTNYNNKGEYAINLRQEVKNDFLFGLAIVYPFVQLQVGYDRVFQKPFAQGGFNVPINWYKR